MFLRKAVVLQRLGAAFGQLISDSFAFVHGFTLFKRRTSSSLARRRFVLNVLTGIPRVAAALLTRHRFEV